MSASNTRSGGAAISISLTTASASGLIRDVAIFLLQSTLFFFSRVRTLFLVLGLHKGLQTGKVALPEIPVLVQPGVDTPQRLGVQPVQPVSPFGAPPPGGLSAAAAGASKSPDAKPETAARSVLRAALPAAKGPARRGASDRPALGRLLLSSSSNM